MAHFKEEPTPEPVKEDVPSTEEIVDSLIGLSPSERQRIKDNQQFIKDVHDHPLPKEKEMDKVFGVHDININAILKDNIWNRGIFTTDHLCRVAFGMNLEQLRKYLGQKRKKPFEHWMLILIIIGVAITLVIVLILMNMNIDFGKIF